MRPVGAIAVAVLVLACAILVQAAAPTTTKAAAGPEDVHIHMTKVAHNKLVAGDTLLSVENKFLTRHTTVMNKLSAMMNQVNKHVDANKKGDIDMVEVAAEGIVIPTIDNTGSVPHGAPKANLTQFTVKPSIDAGLVHDAKLARKIKAQIVVAAPKPAVALVEQEGIVIPTLDDTGSHAHLPKANLTRFKVKPTIDAALSLDAKLVKQSKAAVAAPAAPAPAAASTVPTPALALLEVSGDAETDSESDSDSDSDMEAELAAAGAVEFQASSEFASEAELDADQLAEFEAGAEQGSEVEQLTDLQSAVDENQEFEAEVEDQAVQQVEAEAEADLGVEAAVEAAVAQQTELVEVGAERLIYPVLDNTGDDSYTPKANLTRFKVKPTIDAEFTLDTKLEKKAPKAANVSLIENTVALIEQEGIVIPTLDDTGSHSHTPKANLTRFKVKPVIDEALSLDAKLIKKAKAPVVAPAAAAAPAPAASAAAAPKSLLETRNDCPGCRNRGLKRDYQVVLSPVAAPSSIDAPLYEAQHNAINYLLPKEVASKLSVTQSALNDAQSKIVEAADAHQRFADFKEKHENMPLVPQQE